MIAEQLPLSALTNKTASPWAKTGVQQKTLPARCGKSFAQIVCLHRMLCTDANTDGDGMDTNTVPCSIKLCTCHTSQSCLHHEHKLHHEHNMHLHLNNHIFIQRCRPYATAEVWFALAMDASHKISAHKFVLLAQGRSACRHTCFDSGSVAGEVPWAIYHTVAG